MTRPLLFVAALLSVAGPSVPAARLNAAPDCIALEKDRFDPRQYVFEGRVVAFVTDSSARGAKAFWEPESLAPGENGFAAGLLMEPIQTWATPVPAAHYAVFPREACEDQGPSFLLLREMEAAYVIGDTVAVYARPAWRYEREPEHPHSLDAPVIVRAADVGGAAALAPWSIGPDDYSEVVEAERRLEQLERDPVRDVDQMVAWRGRLEYEYERDLARLHAATADEERHWLLLKARLYWYIDRRIESGWASDCGYVALVEHHLSSPAERDRLGGRLLWSRLRPLASEASCAEARRLRGE